LLRPQCIELGPTGFAEASENVGRSGLEHFTNFGVGDPYGRLKQRLYRRWPCWWLAPLAVTPLLLILAAIALHTSYRDYIRGTQWLVALLGPATVAFAVPIYEQRR
jgi:hypothetical protein